MKASISIFSSMAWTPLQLRSIVAWGQPGGLASDGGSWTDSSPSGNSLVLASALKPTYIANASPGGHPAAQFVNGSSTHLTRNVNLLATNAYMFFVIVRVDAVVSNDVIIGNSDVSQTPGGVTLRRVNSGGSKWNVSHENVFSTNDGAIALATWYRIIVNRASDTNPTIRVNGTDTTLTGLTDAVNTGSGGRMSLGARWNGGTPGSFASCTISEWGWCNISQPLANIVQLDSYLSSKHAIA